MSFMKNIISISLICLLTCAGCASVPITQEKAAVFYPPAPEKPRLQYLTSFSSSTDIEGESSSFSKFVTGDVPEQKIVKPYGVTVKDGKIYACDTVLNSIDIIDLDNRKLEFFQPVGRGQLQSPINLDVAADGTLYVADSRIGQVMIYLPSGKYSTAIGDKGELKPTDVQIWKDKIFICDIKSKKIKVYNLSNHKYLYAIPNAEDESAEAKLYSPTNFAIGPNQHIYISDIGGFKVKEFDMEGNYVASYGTQGDALGQFARPKGIAVDREKRIYVVDSAFENVQIFDPEGNLLLFFPDQDEHNRLVLPAGIAVDYDHVDYFRNYIDKGFKVEYLVFVVSQYGDRKINVYGFGQKQ